MRNKIEAIGNIFKSTFLLYNVLDTTVLEEDKSLYIPKEDRKMMKMLYDLYNLKEYYSSYRTFEGSVIRVSIETNELPVFVAQVICEKLSEI